MRTAIMHTNGDDSTSAISYSPYERAARPKLPDQGEIKGAWRGAHSRTQPRNYLSNARAQADAQNIPYLNVKGANPFV